MSVTRKVRVTVPRKCATCGEDIEGTAVKHRERGEKAAYYHVEGCFRHK